VSARGDRQKQYGKKKFFHRIGAPFEKRSRSIRCPVLPLSQISSRGS
jgi:hypothetical protein